jgi:hypothetical protein
MTQSGKHLATLGACALLAVACDSPAASRLTGVNMAAFAKSDNAPVHRASGGGTVDVAQGRSTYAFHASVDGAGNAKGVFELHFSSVDANVHGDVTCLSVVGNFARLTGVVTSSSDATLIPVGTIYHWQAVDNGEGANAPPDLITAYYRVVTPNFCEYGDLPDNTWTNGNVQVN